MLFIEWWIMLFLMGFEKKYTLDEIVFIQNNTNQFVKKEKKLMCQIVLLFTIINIGLLIVLILGWLENFPGIDIIKDPKD